MINDGKKLGKAEDPAKALFIEILGGVNSRFMDIDTICYSSKVGWIVIEWLKCDKISVRDSHPSRYLHKNWRKFWQLYNIAKKLEGRLYLINYDSQGQQFKLMRVRACSPKVITTEDELLDRAKFTEWVHKLNAACEVVPFDKYDVKII